MNRDTNNSGQGFGITLAIAFGVAVLLLCVFAIYKLM